MGFLNWQYFLSDSGTPPGPFPYDTGMLVHMLHTAGQIMRIDGNLQRIITN